MGNKPTLADWCLDSLAGTTGGSSDREIDLSLVTVVVPSFNRQDYLLRQIRFWASSSARLIIVDGSTLPLESRIRSAVDAQPGMVYLHQPESLIERMSLAAALIETPYAVMLGDDEFHLETGLAAALEVLEKDRDLAGCMGQVLSFSPVGAYRRIVFARAYGSLHDYHIRHHLAEDRLLAAMSEYTMAAPYAVLRTPIWRRSWGSIGNWGSAHAEEIQQAMAVYLLGGLATTSCIQWLRSIENAPLAGTAVDKDNSSSVARSTGLWFPGWWESPIHAAERQAFVTMLAETGSEELGVNRDECSRWVLAAAQAFVDGHRDQFSFDLSSRRTALLLRQLGGSFVRAIARRFPDRLFLGAKRLRGSALRHLGRSGGDYYGTIHDLPKIFESQRITLAEGLTEELSVIEQMVQDFHAIRGGKYLGAE